MKGIMGNVGIKKVKKEKHPAASLWCLEEVEVIGSVQVSVLDDRPGVPSHAPAHTHTQIQTTNI